jgi:hypothetical protein
MIRAAPIRAAHDLFICDGFATTATERMLKTDPKAARLRPVAQRPAFFSAAFDRAALAIDTIEPSESWKKVQLVLVQGMVR